MDVNGKNAEMITDDEEDISKIDLYDPGQIGYLKEDDYILYLSKGDIWKIDRDGTNPSAITKYHDITSFRTSPDNVQILFSREKTKKHNGLFTIHANGTNERQIESSVIIKAAFDWGTSNSIAYFKNRSISTMRGNGTAKKLVIPTFYTDNYVEWSKVGDKAGLIAYISAEENGPNIWVMKQDGKDNKKVTDKGAFSPRWMADGKTLVYVEGYDIYKKDIMTNETKRLTYHFRSYYPVVVKIKTKAAMKKSSEEENDEIIE